MYAEPTEEQRLMSPQDLTNGWTWQKVTERMRIDQDKIGFAQIAILVDLQNVSKQVARIEFPTDQPGEVYTTGDQLIDGPVVLLPDVWTRVIWRNWFPTQEFADDADFAKPENTRFAFRFHAQDLGLNICDDYRFSADLTFFRRTGESFLFIDYRPSERWESKIAVLLPGRKYTRRPDGEA